MSDKGYSYRKCRDHYHVTVVGEDLISGFCETEEEAKEKARRLNEGESLEDVLGSLMDIFLK